ncbi:MAG: RNA polymerase sigma factor, partial [Planctomycetota bacterium]
MDRENEAWLRDLQAQGAAREDAIAELRAILLRGLRRAFSEPRQAEMPFVEDAVQDALVLVIDKLKQFEGRSRFVNWALSIAIRVAMTELRRRRWKDVSLDQLTLDGAAPAPAAEPHDSDPRWLVERDSVLTDLRRLIDSSLTEKQRIAVLAELRGMNQASLAERMGSNRNA